MSDLITRFVPNLITTSKWPAADNMHTVAIGPSGFGKSYLLIHLIESRIAKGEGSVHVVDSEGDLTHQLVSAIARRSPWRRLHLINPASSVRVYGIPLLAVPDRGPQHCHDATVRALSVLGQVVNFSGTDGLGPRMYKLGYTGLFACARRGLPAVALPEIFGTHASIREALADVFSFPFLAEIWSGLNQLPARTLIEYADALISRCLPLFGSPITRRALGQPDERNLDIDAILKNGDIVLLNLGELEHTDRVLIGSAYYAVLHHAGLNRPLTETRPAHVYIDEVAQFVSPDLGVGYDRLRKRSIYITSAAQRLSQFETTRDPTATLFDAIWTNSGCKILFGGIPHIDASRLALDLFGGHTELDTVYKSNSKRPVLVGHRKITLTSRALAQHEAESHALGVSESESHSQMHGISEIASSGSSTALSSGHSNSMSVLPDGTLLSPATHLSRGSANNRGHSTSTNHAHARALVSAHQSAHALAKSRSHGRASGRSEATGTHEAMIAELAMLESESYSLPEKIAAITGFLQAMPKRAALVKLHSNPPLFVPQTPTLELAFRTAAFRDQVMRLFMAKLDRDSAALTPEQADAHIEAALAALQQPQAPEPDFAQPEPFVLPDDPRAFAQAFWQRHAGDSTATSPTDPAQKFRVIDGGKQPGDSNDDA